MCARASAPVGVLVAVRTGCARRGLYFLRDGRRSSAAAVRVAGRCPCTSRARPVNGAAAAAADGVRRRKTQGNNTVNETGGGGGGVFRRSAGVRRALTSRRRRRRVRLASMTSRAPHRGVVARASFDFSLAAGSRHLWLLLRFMRILSLQASYRMIWAVSQVDWSHFNKFKVDSYYDFFLLTRLSYNLYTDFRLTEVKFFFFLYFLIFK